MEFGDGVRSHSEIPCSKFNLGESRTSSQAVCEIFIAVEKLDVSVFRPLRGTGKRVKLITASSQELMRRVVKRKTDLK